MSFIRTYKNIWAGLIVLTCLILFRMYKTHTYTYGFLFWNLFLAVLPLLFSYRTVRIQKPVYAGIMAVLWLLFSPIQLTCSPIWFTFIYVMAFCSGWIL